MVLFVAIRMRGFGFEMSNPVLIAFVQIAPSMRSPVAVAVPSCSAILLRLPQTLPRLQCCVRLRFDPPSLLCSPLDTWTVELSEMVSMHLPEWQNSVQAERCVVPEFCAAC